MASTMPFFKRLSASARTSARRRRGVVLGGEHLETRRLLAATPSLWSSAARVSVPAAPKVALTSDTGVSASDRITRVGTLAVTGTLSGARIGYSVDSGRTWSAAFTAKQGLNTVMVRQTSTAGVNSPATNYSFTLDTTVPTAPRVALTNDTGASATDRVTTVGTLAVTGLEAGARTEFSINGGASWAPTFVAKAGLNNVTVRQTDVAGNASPLAALQFTVDATAPAAPRVALTSDTGASTTDRVTRIGTLAVSGTEPGATVQYSVDAGKSWSPTFAAIEGKNTVQVRQIDVAGNASTATPFEFTRVSSAPVIQSMTFNRTTRATTVVFNRPVTGVSIGDFRISGATGGFAFDYLATDSRLAPYIGAATFSGSGTTWTVTLAKVPPQQSGSYAITLVAANSGITDEAGNVLVTDRWAFLVL
jgi:hypothetical protein